MEGKFAVDIRIESRVGNDVLEQQARGAAYRKSGGWWLQYEECDESGATTQTIVKLAGEDWSVKRNGFIQSAMYFTLGRRLEGSFRSAGVELKLATMTKTMRIDITEGNGVASWEYELAIGDAMPLSHQIVYELTALAHSDD